jgi:hypothetical protein
MEVIIKEHKAILSKNRGTIQNNMTLSIEMNKNQSNSVRSIHFSQIFNLPFLIMFGDSILSFSW